jgi:antitoxin CptB
MLNAENIKDAEQRRLAWRCRRGMLELDIVLQGFVANHFNGLSLAEMHTFDEMLELPDNEFWALLSAPIGSHLSESMCSVITKMTRPQE